jgi:hypothetical protein
LYTRWEGVKPACAKWHVVQVGFVSGHRFSDAATSPKSVASLGAGIEIDFRRRLLGVALPISRAYFT